jgi:hypothetical protein
LLVFIKRKYITMHGFGGGGERGLPLSYIRTLFTNLYADQTTRAQLAQCTLKRKRISCSVHLSESCKIFYAIEREKTTPHNYLLGYVHISCHVTQWQRCILNKEYVTRFFFYWNIRHLLCDLHWRSDRLCVASDSLCRSSLNVKLISWSVYYLTSGLYKFQHLDRLVSAIWFHNISQGSYISCRPPWLRDLGLTRSLLRFTVRSWLRILLGGYVIIPLYLYSSAPISANSVSAVYRGPKKKEN